MKPHPNDIKTGDVVTVKNSVESYCYSGSTARITPGVSAVVCSVHLPWVHGRHRYEDFVLIKWIDSDGRSWTTGVCYTNLQRLEQMQ